MQHTDARNSGGSEGTIFPNLSRFLDFEEQNPGTAKDYSTWFLTGLETSQRTWAERMRATSSARQGSDQTHADYLQQVRDKEERFNRFTHALERVYSEKQTEQSSFDIHRLMRHDSDTGYFVSTEAVYVVGKIEGLTHLATTLRETPNLVSLLRCVEGNVSGPGSRKNKEGEYIRLLSSERGTARLEIVLPNLDQVETLETIAGIHRPLRRSSPLGR